jgi:hypothetical protein
MSTSTVTLKPLRSHRITLRIESLAPMIQHCWSEKAKTMIREKGQGKKTKDRSARDPRQDMEDATYRTLDGRYAIPLLALKNAIIGAAHKDLGIEKTLVRKALFLSSTGGNDRHGSPLIVIDCDPPTMREDCVRVGMGSADLRYRPHFEAWSADVVIDYDADLLRPDDIVTLINRAGFGVGICEWRPEKNGEFGRFRVVTG